MDASDSEGPDRDEFGFFVNQASPLLVEESESDSTLDQQNQNASPPDPAAESDPENFDNLALRLSQRNNYEDESDESEGPNLEVPTEHPEFVEVTRELVHAPISERPNSITEDGRPPGGIPLELRNALIAATGGSENVSLVVGGADGFQLTEDTESNADIPSPSNDLTYSRSSNEILNTFDFSKKLSTTDGNGNSLIPPTPPELTKAEVISVNTVKHMKRDPIVAAQLLVSFGERSRSALDTIFALNNDSDAPLPTKEQLLHNLYVELVHPESLQSNSSLPTAFQNDSPLGWLSPDYIQVMTTEIQKLRVELGEQKWSDTNASAMQNLSKTVKSSEEITIPQTTQPKISDPVVTIATVVTEEQNKGNGLEKLSKYTGLNAEDQMKANLKNEAKPTDVDGIGKSSLVYSLAGISGPPPSRIGQYNLSIDGLGFNKGHNATGTDIEIKSPPAIFVDASELGENFNEQDDENVDEVESTDENNLNSESRTEDGNSSPVDSELDEANTEPDEGEHLDKTVDKEDLNKNDGPNVETASSDSKVAKSEPSIENVPERKLSVTKIPESEPSIENVAELELSVQKVIEYESPVEEASKRSILETTFPTPGASVGTKNTSPAPSICETYAKILTRTIPEDEGRPGQKVVEADEGSILDRMAEAATENTVEAVPTDSVEFPRLVPLPEEPPATQKTKTTRVPPSGSKNKSKANINVRPTLATRSAVTGTPIKRAWNSSGPNHPLKPVLGTARPGASSPQTHSKSSIRSLAAGHNDKAGPILGQKLTASSTPVKSKTGINSPVQNASPVQIASPAQVASACAISPGPADETKNSGSGNSSPLPSAVASTVGPRGRSNGTNAHGSKIRSLSNRPSTVTQPSTYSQRRKDKEAANKGKDLRPITAATAKKSSAMSKPIWR